MGALDAGIVVAIVTTAVMALIVLAFFWLRDTQTRPDRRLALVVTCPVQHQRARVDVLEQHRSGIVIRSVRWCSLRAAGQKCCEQCVWRPPVVAETL